MCTSNSAGIVHFHKNVQKNAVVLAHELGHTLGMDDDSPSCFCPGPSCVMDPCEYNEPKFFVVWSNCSIDALKSNLRRLTCLKLSIDDVVVSLAIYSSAFQLFVFLILFFNIFLILFVFMYRMRITI